MAEDERWVDRSGDRVDVDLGQPGVTVISHRGEAHRRAQDDRPLPEFDASLAAAVAVALENERLQLALHARLEEQQALRRIARSWRRSTGLTR
jgi:hypothetical protein